MGPPRPDDPDGVPTSAVPAVHVDEPRHTDIPLRDFELGIPGTQLINAGADERPLIAVIFTDVDNQRERLRAGQSMMRLMIAAELEGLASCPLSQSVDLVFFRAQLRPLMSWTGYPQMMLRLGQRPDSVPPPLTARLPVGDVLTIAPARPGQPKPTVSPSSQDRRHGPAGPGRGLGRDARITLANRQEAAIMKALRYHGPGAKAWEDVPGQPKPGR